MPLTDDFMLPRRVRTMEQRPPYLVKNALPERIIALGPGAAPKGLGVSNGFHPVHRCLQGYNEIRNPATAATGTLLFTGDVGAAIPQGTGALYGALVFETTTPAVTPLPVWLIWKLPSSSI